MIRAKLEDFFVDEIVPPRVPKEGEHLHVRIEKRGISTEEAVRRICRALGVSQKGVGRCGRKDVRAVTRQWLSLVGVDEARLEELQIEGLNVIEHVRLPRKLRMGRFLGNRFRIRVRELGDHARERFEPRFHEIARRGLRNAFGEQRFGVNGTNARIGECLVSGALDEALELFAADAEGRDADRIRKHLQQGRTQKALALLGRRRAGFYVSAHQSRIFNDVLSARGEAFDEALSGDLFQHHKSGRLLLLEPEEAKPRVASLELSPTGPLPGPSMPRVQGAALEFEAPFLPSESELEASDQRKWFGCLGTRRPLRVPVRDVGIEEGADELGGYLELRFLLPPGAYATQLLLECGLAG